MCDAPDCDEPATRAWERLATQDELDILIGAGDLPPGTTEARLLRAGCNLHRVKPELAVGLHQSTCTAPPAVDGVCDCTPTFPEPDPEP